MRVRDLPLPADVIDHYEAEGVDELYPPQAAAVEAGVTDGERVLAAVPTASGKTFVGELAMLTADGPALYIVPLRALAREKREAFSALPGVSVGISTGDFDATAAELAGHDVVVATSEKVDAAIRNGAPWIEDLACVVVDEVHLLGEEGRGPTLEVTLATLQRRIPDVQIVALSATVANPAEIADWLDAALVESDWRPVDLRTGVYADRRVRFDDGTELTVDLGRAGSGGRGDGEADGADGERGERADGGHGGAAREGDEGSDEDEGNDETDGNDVDDRTAATAALVDDAAAVGGQCLAFVRSRREAERLAERLAAADLGGAPEAAERVGAVDDTEAGERLADCVRSGVAFHHAGLATGHRAAVEAAFRDRELAAICATPTLAAGVNVPARRVVVRDQRRYTGTGTEWLPTLEVHQMCGRAGRPGLDPYGEAILVGEPESRAELRERYVEADPEAVDSKLADPGALRTHVLSIVATGFADTQEGVLDVLGATFHAHQTSRAALGGVVGDAIADLVDMGMIETDGGLAATDLGAQVSRQYVTPETGARIVAGIRRTRDLSAVTDLTALSIVCDTPDMTGTYLGNRERADVYRFARAHAAEFPVAMDEREDFEGWLESVKTARILREYADGASVEDVVDRHRIGPGDLEARLERADWLLGAAETLADTVGIDVPAFGEVREKL